MAYNDGAPEGEGGWSNRSNENYGLGRSWQGDGPDRTGKSGSPGAWGGYSGRWINEPWGMEFDSTHSGRADAVDHLQGLGAAAANQQAYQLQYGQANGYAGLGQDDRQYQVDAMNLTRDTANGNNLQSMALGQNMLRQGVQAQQAGAASARGGALAQAAAMRQQAAGQGAFMQAGNNQLAAQRAAEMAQGREMYMNQATGLRASDAAGQSLNQHQSIQQMQAELQQRQLNQRGEMGYEGLAQDTNIGSANAALGQHEANAGIEDKSMQRHQNKLDQGVGYVGDAASTAGALYASASTYGDKKDTTSDVRAKSHVHSLATAAMARMGARR